ncbi:MAG: DNA repair exonuclease [Coriobacteriia bacterium]|nr:DNA repair exonuclease [Coriobacteriia bacterium]
MTESVRFVHAADLHLDAPFKGVDATDARVREALVASTYEALDALVSVCIEHDADFLVVAGDVYNSSEKSLRAEFAFRDACVRLTDAGIAVFVACGNHDPASGRSAGLTMPHGVHVFSENEVERVLFEREGRPICALYGRSFRTAAEKANLAEGFERRAEDSLAIGVLHANVGGRVDHEPYAPCSLEDLRAAKMDYWALGHIHKPEVLSNDSAVAYSGCTQGLNPNESGLRGCQVVSLEPGSATAEFVPTSSVVWERVTVDAESLESIEDVVGALGSAVDEVARGASDRPVVLRIELVGRTDAHAALARSGVVQDLLADVRAASLERDPWVWVDRIVDGTRPAIDIETLRAGEDFAGDLVRLADVLLADERALLELVSSASGPVLAALDARDVPAVDPAALLERARDLAIDRLLAEEER